MEKIDEHKLLKFYNDTLDKCGTFLLDEDDETIEYNIYEDFDIGIHSFFHIDSLQRLYNNGLISADKLKESISLHNKVINLQNTDEWCFDHFRTSERWKEIMKLCDKIKATE